jgi:hypothetical protein
LQSTTTGIDNVGLGYAALNANTTASNNTAVGNKALLSNTTGLQNTAVGSLALDSNTTGGNNTALGMGALGNSTTASSNTAVGLNASVGNTTGTANVAVGQDTLFAASTASNNIALGKGAGVAVTTGGGNTIIGSDAGDVITTGTDNICIGMDTDPSGSGGVNQIVIGHNISGGENSQFTFGKASNIVQNEFDTDAAWTRTSDIRKKRNVNDDNLGLSFINNLRPVTFQWKPSNEFPKEWEEYSEENNMNLDAVIHGMIAQEVKEALDKEGVDTFGGWKERKDGSQTISREMFITPLINAVKELSTQVDELKAEIQTLKED